MQHDENDEAEYIGKHRLGEHGRRSGAEHFERHAAWERFFLKKMTATLHGSGGAVMPQGRPRPVPPPTPRTTKREPFARRASGPYFKSYFQSQDCSQAQVD